MRIFSVGFLFVLVWLTLSPMCNAEEGVDLGRVTLISKWGQGDELRSRLSFRVDGRWDWVDSRLKVVFHNPGDGQSYSGLNWDLRFPNVSNHLKFNAQHRWNEDYRINASGFTYKIAPWEQLAINWGFAAESREGIPERKRQYSYFLNQGIFALEYDLPGLNYHLNYSSTDKNYPATRRYSSEKQNLVQKITWKPEKGSCLILGYHEAVSDYPYDLSYSASFWKAAWFLKGEHLLRRDFRWNWEYYRMEMVQSRERKQNHEQYKQKLSWKFDPSSHLIAEWVLTEKHHTSMNFYEPEESGTDPLVDTEVLHRRRIKILYRRNWGKISMELGGYGLWMDHEADPKDYFITCYTGSVTFDAGDWRLNLKAAPSGDFQGHLPFYQLRIDYIP